MKKDNSSESKKDLKKDNELQNTEKVIEISTPEDQADIYSNFQTQPKEEIIASLEKERDELKDAVLRKTAELENMRRRVLKEKNELIQYANQSLFQKLLPLMDDFENAIKSGKTSQDFNSLMQGIEMIYNKAVKIFEESGVKKLDIKEGEPFNVEYHEAILKMPSENFEEDAIISVAENGYIYHDKILRHAKVITSAGKSQNEEINQ